jgi:hypothetical protein
MEKAGITIIESKAATPLADAFILKSVGSTYTFKSVCNRAGYN